MRPCVEGIAWVDERLYTQLELGAMNDRARRLKFASGRRTQTPTVDRLLNSAAAHNNQRRGSRGTGSSACTGSATGCRLPEQTKPLTLPQSIPRRAGAASASKGSGIASRNPRHARTRREVLSPRAWSEWCSQPPPSVSRARFLQRISMQGGDALQGASEGR